ncbi:CAP domain-containing protein [Streptosporangium sp. NPDC000396]|uniref:CAP domain-containing protein n=1 Tax=Streptosporangium sp. NPDC000396 TaxID=3366185 RepID=UPI0036ABEEF0
MRRPLGALACLGSLAALSIPATAYAATGSLNTCRVEAATPYVTPDGKIQVSAERLDCDDTTLVRMRLNRAQAGPDRILKSASTRGDKVRITMTASCSPGVYYTLVTDYRGHVAKSEAARLTCSPTPTASPTAPSDSRPGSPEEEEVVRLTNIERQKGGCAPLIHDSKLHKAAQGHSADMASKNYFNHTSQDGRTMTDRIKATGFGPMSAWAENIAMGQRTPAEVVKGWMNSSGHRANIMNCAYTHIGAGMATSGRGPYWTQDFAKGPRTSPTPTASPTATPTASPTSKPTATPTSGQGSSDQEEVVRLTNIERQKGGCGPLKSDPQLQSAAQGHSADMAAKNYFSHTSQDGRTMTDRIKASGFSPMSAWAENIAYGYRTPAEVLKGWMNSSGHRANIMNCAYTHIGVGVAPSSRGPYWTQDFAKH